MRRSLRSWMVGLAMVTGAGLGACVTPPPPGACSGQSCMCIGGSECDLECPATGCVAECADVSNCGAACGDECTLSCHDNSNCDLACGDGCAATCERVSNCEVECGAACAVACTDLSNCNVVMISGEVTCTTVSKCDVRCALPGGGTEPAEACGDGRMRCPVGSC